MTTSLALHSCGARTSLANDISCQRKHQRKSDASPVTTPDFLLQESLASRVGSGLTIKQCNLQTKELQSVTTENPFIPELPPNPDKIQKLFALRELLQKVADLKNDSGSPLFNYADSHFRNKLVNEHPVANILQQEAPEALHECGTPGCVAGWCGILDPKHSVSDTNWWDTNKLLARQFLELTSKEANFLFLCSEYYDHDEDEELYPCWIDQTYGGNLASVPIEEAIKRLDFLIKQNE